MSERVAGSNPGECIRGARNARTWSQSRLAKQADVSRPTIARIEAGQHVRMGTLETVAQALGLSLEMGRTEG